MNFRYPYFLILFLGILVGLFRYKSLIKSNKVFLLLLIITLLFEVYVYSFINEWNSNFFLYNLFIPVYYGVISLGFFKELKKKWILYTNLLSISFLVISSMYTPILEKFNTNALIFTFFLIVILCLLFFNKLLKTETEQSFVHFPLFWISSGELMFCIINLFHYGTYNIFLTVDDNPFIEKLFYNVRVYSNYLLYILFIVAFLVKQNSLLQKDAIKQ